MSSLWNGERPRSACGAGILEFVVAVIVIAVLATLMLERIAFYQEAAEKTAMELTARNIRSGLRLQVAELLLANRAGEIGALALRNPVEFLEKPPANYIGELDDPRPDAMEPGSWYFDRTRRELIYRPYHTRHFDAAATGESVIRFRIAAVGQVMPEGIRRAEWAQFAPVRPYQWL